MVDRYKDYGYSTLGPSNGESGRRLADKIISVVQNCPDIKTICDLGSGNGYIASRLASLGYNVTGVDASQSGIDLARRHFASEDLKFICARIDADLPIILGKKFDLVLSSDVIEHLYRPAGLIEAATALLRPQGYLLVATPYHGYLKNLAIAVLNKWDFHHAVDSDGGHIKFFSVKTLNSLLANNGYINIAFMFYGRIKFFHKNMICLARRPD